MEESLKPVEGITYVETPPFLFRLIQQRLESEFKSRVSKSTAYSFAASFALLLVINVFIILQCNQATEEEAIIVQIFRLMPDNNLYK